MLYHVKRVEKPDKWCSELVVTWCLFDEGGSVVAVYKKKKDAERARDLNNTYDIEELIEMKRKV